MYVRGVCVSVCLEVYMCEVCSVCVASVLWPCLQEALGKAQVRAPTLHLVLGLQS